MYIENWEQVEIFEFMDNTEREFKAFDRVTVKSPADDDPAETFYYLQTYAGKIGEVVRRVGKRLRQYEVAFPGMDRHGVFRANELQPVKEDFD